MLTEDQDKLASQLEKYSPSIKTAYLGALHALNAKNYPDRLVHFCHSLREVIDNLARINDTNNRKNNKHDTRAKRLERVIDPTGAHHGISKNQYQRLDKHYYSYLSEISHHNEPVTQSQCRQIHLEIESILLTLTTPQTLVLPKIEQIITQKPTEENAKKLQDLLFRRSSDIYLLEQLSPDWLVCLRDIDFFKCSKFREQLGNDSLNFAWIPSRFLIKCAKAKPDITRDIILGCNFHKTYTRNWIVISDFLECAVILPIPHAEKISQKALGEKWHDHIYEQDPEKYADLMEKMFLAEKYDLAIEMAHNLFRLKLDTSEQNVFYGIKSIIHQYSFENILNNKITVMCKKNPLHIVRLLVNILNESITLLVSKYPSPDSQNDFSSKWRSAVEEHDQNLSRIPHSFLVQHLRECLEHVSQENPDNLKECLTILKQKQYYIFRRVEMHIYRKFADKFKDEIENTLLNYVGNDNVYHEYYELIKVTFGLMSKNTQNAIISKIDNTYKTRLENYESNQNIDLAKKCAMLWKCRRFEPIQKHLDDKYQKDYDDLVDEFKGTPPHPEFLSYMSLSSFDSKTTPGQFSNKSSKEVFEIIRKRKIVHDVFSDEHVFVTEFKEYVELHQEYCSQNALDLKDADPVFLCALFHGLGNSILGKKQIDWNGFLKLAEFITCSTNKTYHNPIMCNLAIEICVMLEKGFENEMISFDLQKRILILVLKLVKISDMLSKQNNSFDNNMDLFNLVTNNLARKSFSILSKYAMWYKQNDKSKKFSPDVKQIFNEYLSNKKKHTAARHAILGVYFHDLYYLDKEWTKTIYGRIATNMELKIAFWEGYISNELYSDVFDDIHSLYNEFLNAKILKNSRKKIRIKTIHNNTIYHVTLAYVYDLDKADVIFSKFTKNADNDAIKHCIYCLEVIVDNYKDGMPINKCKVKKLLNDDKFIKHAAMNRWFQNKMFDKKEIICIFLNFLDKSDNPKNDFFHIMVEDMQCYISNYPLEVAKCLKLILDNQKRSSDSPIPDIKSMLNSLLETQNANVNKICCDIQETLVDLGYNDYRNL